MSVGCPRCTRYPLYTGSLPHEMNIRFRVGNLLNTILSWLIVQSTAPVTFLSATILLSGVIAAAITGEWHIFPRTGSILVILGVVLTLRGPLRFHLMQAQIARVRKYIPGQDEAHKNANEHARKTQGKELWQVLHLSGEKDDFGFAKRGFWIAVIGTLVWGFGDLLGHLPVLKFSHG